MLGRSWRCQELLVSSSTFTVIQRIHKSVLAQKHPHWKNTNKYMKNTQLMQGAHTQGVVGVHQVK